MGFPSAALTAGNYTSIRRNSYRSIQYFSTIPNTVLQTTTLASVPALSNSVPTYAQFSLTNTVDADVEEGHTVIVTLDSTFTVSTNITGLYRVRKAPSGSTLYINEADIPLLSGETWYVHIIDDYRIYPKIGRVSGANYYKDYDRAFNLPRPLINNLQSAYVDFIDSGTSVYEISFAPSFQAMQDSATASTWLWDVQDGTITTGTTASQNITATFPEGFRWVTVSVQDSNGVFGWRRIPVWAHGSTYTPASGFNGATITGNWESGYSATVTAFDGIDEYLDETLCVIWRKELYGTTEESIVNNIDFIGRFRTETNRVSGDEFQGTLVPDTEFTIEGIGQILQRIPGPVITVWDNQGTTPTLWDYIYKATPARAIVHVLKEHTTFCELHDVTWTSRFGDTYRFLAFGTSQNDVLSTVNDIAFSVNGMMEFAPSGETRLTEDVRLATNIDTPYTDFADGDTLAVNVIRDHIDKFAKVEGSGGVYNANSRTIEPFISTKPGAIGTTGYQIGSLDRQIITDAPELWSRLVNYLSMLNAELSLEVAFPDGYHFLIPSRFIKYRFDLSGDTNNRGYTITDGDFLLTEITMRHENPGEINLHGTREVTTKFVEYNAAITEDISGEGIPPYDNPDLADGNLVTVWDSDSVWVTLEFKKTDEPVWNDITPGDLTANESVVACAWSLISKRFYVLSYDSNTVQSRVWTKQNGANLNEDWSVGAAVSGQYEIIRPTHEDAHLYLYGSNVSSSAKEVFSSDSGGSFTTATTIGATGGKAFDVIKATTGALGAYSGNVGITTTESGTYSSYSTATSNAAFIFAPRLLFGTDTTANSNGITTPEYLMSRSTVAAALEKVTNSGATITNIAPNDGTFNGGVPTNSPNSVHMPWRSGKRMAGLFSFSTNGKKLAVSSNTGTSWTTSATLGVSSGNYVRFRTNDTASKEIYFIGNGATNVSYSPDFGTTIEDKPGPLDVARSLLGIEVYK